MKRYWRNLLILFLIFSVAKAAMSYFIKSPTIFADEYLYFKLANSFHHNLNFVLHGELAGTYPPLYSSVISSAHFVENAASAYTIIKIMNAFLSSLIIFPTFFLAREITTENKATLAAALSISLPAAFSSSFYIVAENLFYPLFLTAVFLIYKSFKENNYRWDLFAGIFIGLTILTKYLGFVLIILVFVLSLFYLIKKKEFSIKGKILLLTITTLTTSIWFIRNSLSTQNVLGSYTFKLISLPNAVSWFVIYLGYATLAITVFFLLFFSADKPSPNQKLMGRTTLILFITTILVVIIAASAHMKADTLFPWLLARPIGRYIETIFPLFVAVGIANIKNYDKKKLKFAVLLLTPVLLISSQLAFFSLFPINNSSLILFGLFAKGIALLTTNIWYISTVFSAILLLTLFISWFLILKLKSYQLIALLLIFFISVSMLNYVAIYSNSRIWSENPNFQAGVFLAKTVSRDDVVLIDVRDCEGYDVKNTNNLCSKNNRVSLVGFWVNNLKFVNPDQDAYYFDSLCKYTGKTCIAVSRHKLNYILLQEFDGTQIYEIK